jgi:putative DNA primase/helicase
MEHGGVKVAGSTHPALVGKIASFEGKAVNLHLTLLTPSGEKASLEPSKRVMKGKLPDGCAIRIGEAGPLMGVAEGVETAVSASIMYGIPVWACVNGTLLSKWMPPTLAKEIVVFGDNDRNFAGQAKAYTLANRLEVIHKRRVTVEIPDMPGSDWNDIHRNQLFK